MGLYTDGREGVLDETGGEQHTITEAAPNELKLGRGWVRVMRASHRTDHDLDHLDHFLADMEKMCIRSRSYRSYPAKHVQIMPIIQILST